MGRQPIYHNVKGAPFNIGDRVRVLGGTDETFNPGYKGRVGTVRYFEYSCGCGQTYPTDPMIGVSFRGGCTEELWKEELKRQTAQFVRTVPDYPKACRLNPRQISSNVVAAPRSTMRSYRTNAMPSDFAIRSASLLKSEAISIPIGHSLSSSM